MQHNCAISAKLSKYPERWGLERGSHLGLSLLLPNSSSPDLWIIMKLSLISVIICLAVQSALAAPKVNKPRKTAPLLINPDAQPDLPTARVAQAAADAAGLNITDVQGDILIGMKKNKELFFFFGIKNATDFKSKLSSDIAPLITPTNALLPGSTPPDTAVNIAFSKTGLDTLGVTDDLGDISFNGGQFTDATALGDPGTGNWVPGFAGTNIHGVLLLASGTVDNINDELASIQSALGDSITEIYRLQGAARPGDQEGHEHFGFMDGISQPAVNGFTPDVHPGQMNVSASTILLGVDGDNTRPPWATGGSFLAFRQLQQKVPEFEKYLVDNALDMPGLTPQENAELLGARFIGRWKSGAPIDLAPLRDDPDLAIDVNRNNDFTFDHPEIPGFDITTNQTFCPFSAHIRKSRPRDDFSPDESFTRPIMRAGIPYGPEVTDDEKASNTSSSDPSLERGLAFVSYQSDLNTGFRFIQQNWVDAADFFFGKSHSGECPVRQPNQPFDPIIGRDSNAGSVAPPDSDRTISGSDPLDKNHIFTLDIDFVVSRGGEYFFSPPISALTGKLAQ
ncbi:hypothetical protein D9758_009862 [Tetrapyrgos nigripes]|uniref:Uncharacterized protein n=1 Tax=Tetrapyrgos nigripes TaxID=182062 RepID=A0A8H5GMK6_9AGAR|nr:hypothetical protein D9758_009862 [Tetrapyrgos nigripes]